MCCALWTSLCAVGWVRSARGELWWSALLTSSLGVVCGLLQTQMHRSLLRWTSVKSKVSWSRVLAMAS